MKLKYFLFMILSSTVALASREVEFEWEEVEGAKFYQVEIRKKNEIIQKLESKSFVFKTTITPGKYQIHGRVHSVGPKNSESDWSAWKDFDIPPSKIITKPLEKYEFQADTKSYTSKITLEWLPVDGADIYRIEVFDDKNILKKSHDTKSLKTTMQLRPGYYTVRLTARTDDELTSEPSYLEKPILIQNVPVEPPKKVELDLKNRVLRFEPAPGTSLHLSLQRQDFLGDDWIEVLNQNPEANYYRWSPSLRPGKYRFTLLSRNPYDEVSKPLVQEFEIKPQEKDLPSE